jgi:hypothetical protein
MVLLLNKDHHHPSLPFPSFLLLLLLRGSKNGFIPHCKALSTLRYKSKEGCPTLKLPFLSNV